MAARILDGKALGLSVRASVTSEVERFLAETGITPGLTVILVGDRPASQVYVRNKGNACKAARMRRSMASRWIGVSGGGNVVSQAIMGWRMGECIGRHAMGKRGKRQRATIVLEIHAGLVHRRRAPNR